LLLAIAARPGLIYTIASGARIFYSGSSVQNTIFYCGGRAVKRAIPKFDGSPGGGSTRTRVTRRDNFSKRTRTDSSETRCFSRCRSGDAPKTTDKCTTIPMPSTRNAFVLCVRTDTIDGRNDCNNLAIQNKSINSFRSVKRTFSYTFVDKTRKHVEHTNVPSKFGRGKL